jgi:hypothetical protein
MSHFYGTLQGTRKTIVTRCGSIRSGIETYAASWQGAVRVFLREEDGIDMAEVYLVPWHGRGTSKLLYSGPVSGKEKQVAEVEPKATQSNYKEKS